MPKSWCRDISDTFYTKIEVDKNCIQTGLKRTVWQAGCSAPSFRDGKGFAMSHKPTISVTPRGDAHMTLLLCSLKKELNGVWSEHFHSAQSKEVSWLPLKIIILTPRTLNHDIQWLFELFPSPPRLTIQLWGNEPSKLRPHPLASRDRSEVATYISTNIDSFTIISALRTSILQILGFFAPRFRQPIMPCSKAVE